jgi:hypothetical protein
VNSNPDRGEHRRRSPHCSFLRSLEPKPDCQVLNIDDLEKNLTSSEPIEAQMEELHAHITDLANFLHLQDSNIGVANLTTRRSGLTIISSIGKEHHMSHRDCLVLKNIPLRKGIREVIATIIERLIFRDNPFDGDTRYESVKSVVEMDTTSEQPKVIDVY